MSILISSKLMFFSYRQLKKTPLHKKIIFKVIKYITIVEQIIYFLNSNYYIKVLLLQDANNNNSLTLI